MIKINRFKIGKKYSGFSIKILWFKFERIGFRNRFLWRLEFSNWKD
jgi:hypothetical protein